MKLIKPFFTILILISNYFSFAQDDQIYKLTFSDASNFNIMTQLGHNRPKTLLILDSTRTWSSNRFWLPEFEEATPEVLKKIKRDEHHAYYHSYLFKDTMLNSLIPKEERKALSQKVISIPSTKINFKEKGYTTIASAKDITGFYIITTQPVYSSDNNMAFIDLTYLYKNTKTQDINETYFGHTCIIYQKTNDGEWKKIKNIDYLIL